MESMFITYLITAITIVALAWLILKQYYPQAVLTMAGIFLYLIAHWFGGVPIVENSSGIAILDVFTKLKDIFAYRAGGLGLIIMSVAGFAVYMSHIGAAQALVRVSVKPVSMINNPWVILAIAYLIGIFVSLFITSATGLGLLLMVTLYPVLIGAGISKASAVGVIATSQAFEIGHVQSNVIRASEVIDMSPVDYFVGHQLITAIVLVTVTMFVHVWWQRRCDIKDGWNPRDNVNKGDSIDDIKDESGKIDSIKEQVNLAPTWYAIFPLVPFVLLLVFSKLILGNEGVVEWVKGFWPSYPLEKTTMNVVVSMLMPAMLIMVIHGIRLRSFRIITDGYKVYLDGMASVFASVVVLIVSAQIFAESLKDMGAIQAFLDLSSGLGAGGAVMIAVVTLLIVFSAILMGSGNASFMSFAELAPQIAAKFGLSSVSVILPMQIASSIGRSMSPIAAVVVATAGIAGISPIEVVRRTIVPMISALIVLYIWVIVLHI